jgi:hypothetical protein
VANTNISYLSKYQTLKVARVVLEQGDALQSGSLGMATEGEVRAAEIAASDARTDTKIVRLEGKLDLVLSKFDSVNTHIDSVSTRITDMKDDLRSTRNNIWVVGLGLAGLIVVVVALFPVFFDVGSKMRDLIQTEVSRALPKSP